MRFFKLALVVALASLAAKAQQPLAPQTTPAAPQRDPQALAILTLSLTTMGPAGAMARDSVAQGTITFAEGRIGSIILKTKGVDRCRNEVSLSGENSVMIVSGGKGHVVDAAGNRQLPPWVTAYLRPQHIPALSRMSESANPTTNVIYVGTEDVNGRLAHHIRLSANPSAGKRAEIEGIISEFHVFVDTQTNIVVKTITFDFSPLLIQNRTPVETFFSDYRQIGGVLVAHRITRYIRGNKDSDIVLDSVQFNVGLSDTDFQ